MRPDHRIARSAWLVAASLCCAATLPAQAQQVQSEAPAAADPVGEIDVLTIDSTAGSVGNVGRVAVNASAGNNNQQANTGIVALGNTAIGVGYVRQSSDVATPEGPLQASASIAGDAFANSRGMIGVNAVAGSNNQTANLAIFATGIEGRAAADAVLSQTRSSQQPTGQPDQAAATSTLANVSEGAFKGSSGLVQVNLIGGERNSSANVFALTTSGSAIP